VEKRHRVLRRTGAVVEAACSISANPHCRFSGSIAFRRPGLRRIGISSGSLVSNTAASMTGIELGQRGAGAGLAIGLRQGRRCLRRQQRDIPVDRVARAEGTSPLNSGHERWRKTIDLIWHGSN
jgi:hypothetical protein